MRLMTLDPAEPRQRGRGERVRHLMRRLLACSGSHSFEDIGPYMRLCSHADALKQRGFVVRIRGKRKRWLIEITGGKRASPSSGTPPRTTRVPSRVIPLLPLKTRHQQSPPVPGTRAIPSPAPELSADL